MESKFHYNKEAMAFEIRKEYYNNRARWIARYTYKNALAVKKRMEAAGLWPSQIGQLEDLERVPSARLADRDRGAGTQLPFGDLLARHISSLERVFMVPVA